MTMISRIPALRIAARTEKLDKPNGVAEERNCPRDARAYYSITSVTWPEATVWPPSRMANLSPFSMAIG